MGPLGPIEAPNEVLLGPQWGPRGLNEAPPILARMGLILAPTGPHWGLNGASLGPRWGLIGAQRGPIETPMGPPRGLVEVSLVPQ